MLDVFAIFGLDWIYDKVEDRYGRAAAWIVTATLAVAIMVTGVALIASFFRD
jgi:hypothetical protein